MVNIDVLVVGGGVSGLTAAYEVRRSNPHLSVAVIESGDRVGGIIGTMVDGDWVVDSGPHGFVDNGVDTIALVQDLGIEADLQRASRRSGRIYMMRDEDLSEIPSSLGTLLRSNLLSARAKVRLLAEPFVRACADEEDVTEFVSRRFGAEVAERLAAPAVRGVVGADASTFTVDGEFPIIKQLERAYGSVLVGAVLHQRRRHVHDSQATRTPSFQEFGQRLCTFRRIGMQRLIDALEQRLGEAVFTSCSLQQLERQPSGLWQVHTSSGTFQAGQVVLATPAPVTATFVEPWSTGLATHLRGLPMPDIVVGAMGYRLRDMRRRPDGIGFVASLDRGKAALLGGINASVCFADQAPPGHALLRVLAGGSRDTPILGVGPEEALSLIHGDIRTPFGIAQGPVYQHHRVWRSAIPTYAVGHRSRTRTLLDELRATRGLHVCGNAFFGVGVNDCVRDARRAADELTRERALMHIPVAAEFASDDHPEPVLSRA